MVFVVFFYNNELRRMEFSKPTTFSAGSGKKDDLVLSNLNKHQITGQFKKGVLTVYNSGTDYSNGIYPGTKDFLTDSEISVMWEECDTKTEIMKLPYRCTVRIGRNPENDIVIQDQHISNFHCVLTNDCGTLRVEDRGSTNGLYLNGRRIQKSTMAQGDVLELLHYQVKYVNGALEISNHNGRVSLRSQSKMNNEFEWGNVSQLRPVFNRSPRIREQLPQKPIILSNPPSKQGQLGKRRGAYASLLGSGAMIGANIALGAVSPALMAARAAGLISPVIHGVLNSQDSKEAKKRYKDYEYLRQTKYVEYIEGQKAKILNVAAEQRRIISQENPDPTACCEITVRRKPTLWERKPNDSDFLSVRLGMSYEPLCVEVKSPFEMDAFHMESELIEQLAQDIIEETRIVDDVPARVSLERYQCIGVVGDRSRVIRQIQNMLVCLTTNHYHEDVRLVGIFDEEEKSHWEALRWLPSIWDENGESRYLAFQEADFKKLGELMIDTLNTRRKEKDTRGPHYVFILGSRRMAHDSSLESLLLSCDPQLRATTLFLYDRPSWLPHQCQFMIDLGSGSETPKAYDVNAYNHPFCFTQDDALTSGEFDQFCRAMAAVEVDRPESVRELPASVTFLQGYGVSAVQQLRIWERWQSNRHAETMAAPMAVMRGGKQFLLDVRKTHGPHGLVAGTPGSGKSELLISWLLSVAVNYHPHDVSFVVIDYKVDFSSRMRMIPHTVGVISNLEDDSSRIMRYIQSLDGELARRKRLFAQVGATVLGEYIKAYYEGKASVWLPWLLIVTDEFAEMKKEIPEAVKALISVSAIGRSLGIRLVLATQDPSGVVDELIKSNSMLRICMKVANAGASREVIGSPEAAGIQQAGRAYIGNANETFTQVQSFWSWAPYLESAQDRGGNAVRLVGINGERIKPVLEEKTRGRSTSKELEVIVRHMASVMKTHGISKLPPPWRPELPEILWLSELDLPPYFDGMQWQQKLPWLQVPIGRFDLPTQQAQGAQMLDLTECHYGIYGAPGTGKTTMLKTILTALGMWYTPHDISIYILDFGGWNMRILEQMPHVGGIVLSDEEEKFSKLKLMLLEEINRRRSLFLEHNVGTLEDYRELVSDQLPAIIVAIDNIAAFSEYYPEEDKLLMKIAKDGMSYGLYLVFTANTPSDIKYKLSEAIKGAITFEQVDKTNYLQILGGRPEHALSKIKGRGLFKTGGSPLEFQAALFCDGETEQERNRNLQKLLEQMNRAWKQERPMRIPIMPEVVTEALLVNEFQDRNLIPVGFGCDTIEPVYLDLRNTYSAMLAGGTGSGKSRILCGIARLISRKWPDTEIYVFDSLRKSLGPIQSLSKEYLCVSEKERLSAVIHALAMQLEERDFAKDENRLDAYPQICILLDDIHDFLEQATDESYEMMDRILRLAQGLKVQVIAAGRNSDLERNMHLEQITRDFLAGQVGLAVSGSASVHRYFKHNLDYKEREAVLSKGYGLCYHEGECRRIKMLNGDG